MQTGAQPNAALRGSQTQATNHRAQPYATRNPGSYAANNELATQQTTRAQGAGGSRVVPLTIPPNATENQNSPRVVQPPEVQVQQDLQTQLKCSR